MGKVTELMQARKEASTNASPTVYFYDRKRRKAEKREKETERRIRPRERERENFWQRKDSKVTASVTNMARSGATYLHCFAQSLCGSPSLSLSLCNTQFRSILSLYLGQHLRCGGRRSRSSTSSTKRTHSRPAFYFVPSLLSRQENTTKKWQWNLLFI